MKNRSSHRRVFLVSQQTFYYCVKIIPTDDPEPVLTLSTSWLSSGDPLALTCSIEDVSAGWRFYWYKAVPKLSINYYSFELLPGSSNGTQDDSFTVREHTHTGGYYCTAGRGDPVYLTKHSKLKFVWSGGRFVLFHAHQSFASHSDIQYFPSRSRTNSQNSGGLA